MNECMYAQVTSSTMKSLAHCGRGREKSGKIEGHKMRWTVFVFYAFDGETTYTTHVGVRIRSKFED